MKVLVADYGLNEWYGGLYDYEARLKMLKNIGYDGLERLRAATEADVLSYSALANKMGMCFATCEGTTPMHSLLWSAALNMDYIWIGSHSLDNRVFTQHAKAQTEAIKPYRVRAAVHNHLGCAVETEAELIAFLDECPDAGLILDIGHLVGAGGDPLKIIDRYLDRIVMVHLKDFIYTDKDSPVWHKRLRFCELGTGELGELTGEVIKRLIALGYDKYLAVEHDTHLRDPEIDLKNSRDFIRKYGV